MHKCSLFSLTGHLIGGRTHFLWFCSCKKKVAKIFKGCQEDAEKLTKSGIIYRTFCQFQAAFRISCLHDHTARVSVVCLVRTNICYFEILNLENVFQTVLSDDSRTYRSLAFFRLRALWWGASGSLAGHSWPLSVFSSLDR